MQHTQTIILLFSVFEWFHFDRLLVHFLRRAYFVVHVVCNTNIKKLFCMWYFCKYIANISTTKNELTFFLCRLTQFHVVLVVKFTGKKHYLVTVYIHRNCMILNRFYVCFSIWSWKTTLIMHFMKGYIYTYCTSPSEISIIRR